MARLIRHRWDLTPKEAIALQRELADKVLDEHLRRKVQRVAGCDGCFVRNGKSIIAGCVVWDLERKEVVERTHVIRDCAFPYVPGLLSFREAPAVIEAAGMLESRPDVFMLDGQGMAHPRRLGLACHVGLLLDAPTIGCAKSRLCGEFTEPAASRGSSRKLVHDGDVVGRVVRTRANVKPLFVSVGHRVTLSEAEALVLQCCTNYRLPEPTRLADRFVAECKRKYERNER